jgi:rhodanese-related sulfurtransferase
MKTDGRLLRLNKTDFIELLKAPLINQVAFADAQQRVQAGAVWMDVRFPSEYRFDHIPEAINVPLNEIRAQLKTLDKSKQFIVYCQTGRRSSAAAFILAQHGFKAEVLKDGIKLKPQ